MRISARAVLFLSLVMFIAAVFLFCYQASAQSSSSSGVIQGVVTDSTNAVVPGAKVEIHNPVSGYSRTVTTDAAGRFSLPNLPFNPYHLTVTVKGFAPHVQDVDVRSVVPVAVNIGLQVAGSNETVTVEANGGDLVETNPTFHTDVDRNLFNKIPLESSSSSVSSLVTLASPGIAADSNGLFHGMGDHAENSFSVDGQPITDQQSKIFSNQIPIDSIQSLEVITGAPPAEFGEKASVVINVTTRSGLGEKIPHGDLTATYGSFGTSNAGFNLAYGGDKWG
ncbi:MAG TPA: TonB-dependent receptor, partial [Candidatus Angelobacter sp.]|nr:TonB-dependent receptor [Candidatus Angelobacter sp.]